MNNKIKETRDAPKGMVPLIGVFLVVLFIPLLVLTVDISNALRVKSELQVAAEFASLSGAQRLFYQGTGPDWASGEAQASEIGRLHYAQGLSLEDLEIRVGFWDSKDPGKIRPPLSSDSVFDQYPAVSVTIYKSSEKNAGPFTPAFGSVIGLGAVDLSVTATSVVSGVGEVDARTLFPFVMSRCLYQNFWDVAGDPAGPRLDPITGQPYIFQLGDGYMTPPCGTLQGFWMTYLAPDNSASNMRELLSERNPEPVKIGDQVWLPTGQMNTVYAELAKQIQNCQKTGETDCNNVIVAVVDEPQQGDWLPVQAFSCIRLVSAEGGSKPNVRVQMNTSCDTTGTGGMGPPLIVTGPKLVQ